MHTAVFSCTLIHCEQKLLAVLITCHENYSASGLFSWGGTGWQQDLALALSCRCFYEREGLLIFSLKRVKWDNQSRWLLVFTNVRVGDCTKQCCPGKQPGKWGGTGGWPCRISPAQTQAGVVSHYHAKELSVSFSQNCLLPYASKREAFSCPKPAGMQAQAAAQLWQSHSLFSVSPVLWNMRKRRVLCYSHSDGACA